MARTSTSGATTKRIPKSTHVTIKARGTKPLAADAPLPGEQPLRKMAKPSETVLVNALANAEGFHRDALLIEISVGLALFASLTETAKVDLPMKKQLRAIYEKAGYACATPEGENYKSVQRWIGATAALFTHLGGYETIRDWVDDAPASKHVVRIQEALGPKKFAYISDVLTYVGKPPQKKPRKATAAPAQAPASAPTEPAKELSDTEKLMAAQLDAQILERKLAQEAGMPSGRIFTKGPLQLAVPFNASYNDVMSLVEELMTFAKTQMPLPVDKGLWVRRQPPEAAMPAYQVVVHNVPGSGTVRLGTVDAPTYTDAKAAALVKFGEEGLRPVATEQQKALAIYDDDDFDVRLCK